MSSNVVQDIFSLGGTTIARDVKGKKKKSRRKKRAAEEKKSADDLTNAFGRTLLNDPLGQSRSLLQGRPGGAGGGSVLGG